MKRSELTYSLTLVMLFEGLERNLHVRHEILVQVRKSCAEPCGSAEPCSSAEVTKYVAHWVKSWSINSNSITH